MGKQGEPYRPSNGTEGMYFMEQHCEQCIHDHGPTEKYCELITAAMCFDPKDKDYPDEWTYDADGKPTCTKWTKWDWGDGYDGFNEPPEPPYEPQDPNQLMLFSVADEILQNHEAGKATIL